MVSCFFLMIGIVVVFFVFAIILRGSVWLANKCIGVSARDRSRYPDEEDEEEDWDAYARPAHQPHQPHRAIPEPGVLRGMGIALMVFIASLIMLVVMAVVVEGLSNDGGLGRKKEFDSGLEFAGGVCGLLLAFVVWAGLLSALLPTSLSRASLVTLFLYLIGFGLFVTISALLLVVRVGFGGFP